MGVFTTSPRTWASSEVVTATNLNAQLKDFIAGFGAWTSYTPTVSGFTSVTTSVTGAYTQIQKMVHWRAQITISTVTTLGSSQITVSLPVTSVSLPTGSILGQASYRLNAGTVFLGYAFNQSTTTAGIRVPSGTAVSNVSTWTGAVPSGQVAGDVWTIEGFYEAA